MKYYYEDETQSFVIEQYNKSKPFASFLPGIAGKNGIPLWVFYVNRGQCISSFGIGDKNNAIMEFFPANNAYKMTPINGFRTFCKLKGQNSSKTYEIFSIHQNKSKQQLKIKPNTFSIEEETPFGLHFTVSYFILPNSDFAALVRKVSVKNLTEEACSFELLDGLAQVIPYGVNMETSKFMSYTSRAWMTVKNLEHDIAFFKLTMSTGDSAEVTQINNGNFCLSFLTKDSSQKLLKPIVDPSVIFGSDTSLLQPIKFNEMSLSELHQQSQITEGRVPCNFVGTELNLEKSQEISLYTIIGQVNDINWINNKKSELTQAKFITTKEHESNQVIYSILNNIATHTSNKLFDRYSEQTYLDNILRGGYPIVFKGQENDKVVHLYIRKHGDQERDYNWFFLEPSYYSQGNGNYRDVNQNRRCDVSFNPKVGDFNIKAFMNLIQADGFNPLVITGTSFLVSEENLHHILSLTVDDDVRVKEFLKTSFTIGKLIEFLINNNIKLKIDVDGFIKTVLHYAHQTVNAIHGEGFWIDHWTYNLDLIENYLNIFPEKEFKLFFDDPTYKFYDNFVGVKPRDDKYVLVHGKIRQYDHLFKDSKKEELIKQRQSDSNFLRIKSGLGEIYETTLFVKLLVLVLNKFATLDPYGMGVEMESGKPGWSDAMNGLPGIFGSSMPETYELQRYYEFLITLIKNNQTKISEISLPIEIYNFLIKIEKTIEEYYQSQAENKQHLYWDKTANIREDYRKSVFYGFNGEEKKLSVQKIEHILKLCLEKIKHGIELALSLNDGIYPTYFYFEVDKYSIIKESDGRPKSNEKGYSNVTVDSFTPNVLPIFLEGFARALKIQATKDQARDIWLKVRDSALYDHKLKMYKLNSPLKDQPDEIGRAKGFTSGWLENGSIWMHMEYKYLLELLNNDLFSEFYEDFQNVLIPFQDPAIYGRPTTENSSFICSSAYPDVNLHGNGFYARLSGSTAEFLHIWNLMMVGKQPFYVDQDQTLSLRFKPVLAEWLFTKNNTIDFMFLSSCKVTYHNPNRKNTYEDCSIRKIKLNSGDKSPVIIEGAVIKEPYSLQIREGKIKQIDLFME